MNHKYLKIILFSGLVFLLISCTHSFVKQHPDVMDKYRSFPQNKALAIAKDYDGGFAYGYSKNYNSIQKAKVKALAECKARRKARKLKNACSILYINDKKVNQ